MLMLYVIMMNGTIAMQDLNMSDSDYLCLAVATELRKSDKVADAFCLINDPNDPANKVKIGRRESDGQASN